MEWLSQIKEGLLYFEFYYPLFMAYVWIIGALYYRFHWESSELPSYSNPASELYIYPPVTYMVPCYNEASQIRETIRHLDEQDYPEFEIIAINDGSTDKTGAILDQLAEEHSSLRVIHLQNNQGKAMAMRMGTLAAKHEYLVCIDSDAILDKQASRWLIQHFNQSPRVGAVTGNPRIRTRSTLLGKIQVGEFSAIIGIIKRAQRIYGRIFTVSGVVTAFRKSALHQAGYWHTDTVTDDIDISWKLQLNYWDIRYEPNALCWILMPETLRGLWSQRTRWAQGGMEAFIRYLPYLKQWRSRRMWGVYLEYFVSVIWSYIMGLIFILWILNQIVLMPEALYIPSLLPGWNGVILGVTCLLQFAISMFIDSRVEKGIAKYYYWMIWYPIAYWVINVLTTIVAVPRAIFGKHRRFETWISPDRGITND